MSVSTGEIVAPKPPTVHKYRDGGDGVFGCDWVGKHTIAMGASNHVVEIILLVTNFSFDIQGSRPFRGLSPERPPTRPLTVSDRNNIIRRIEQMSLFV